MTIALQPYKSTPVFDENTLPQALQNVHRTKAGVWGLIRLIEGELKLTIMEPHSEQALSSGQTAVVRPEQPHFVTPLGRIKMQIDFYDQPPIVD